MFKRSKNFLLGLDGLFGTMLQRKVETIPETVPVVPVPKAARRSSVWSGIRQAMQYATDPDLYRRAQDGSIRLRKGKANSRADTRRELGVIIRSIKLCRMGRITRLDVEARANRIGWTVEGRPGFFHFA